MPEPVKTQPKRLTRDQLEDIKSRLLGTPFENDLRALMEHAEAEYHEGKQAGLDEAVWETVDSEVYYTLRNGLRDIIWRIRSGLIDGDTAIAQELEGLAT